MRIVFLALFFCSVKLFAQSPAPKAYKLCDGLNALKKAAATGFRSIINEDFSETTMNYSSKIEIEGFSTSNGTANTNVFISKAINFFNVSGYSFYDENADAVKRYNELKSQIAKCWNVLGVETVTPKNTNTTWSFKDLKDDSGNTYNVDVTTEVYFNTKQKKWSVNYVVAKK